MGDENRSTPLEIKANHTAEVRVRLSDARAIENVDVQYIAQAGDGSGGPDEPPPPQTIKCRVVAEVNGKRDAIATIGIISPNGALSRPPLTALSDGRYKFDCVPGRYLLVESEGGYSTTYRIPANGAGNPYTFKAEQGLPPEVFVERHPVEVRLVPGVDRDGKQPEQYRTKYAGKAFLQGNSIVYQAGMELPEPGEPTARGWRNYANIASLIPSANQGQQTISLGGFGRLLLRFDPPLVLIPGIPLITFTEDGPIEACEVRFGTDIEQVAESGAHPAGDAIAGAGRLDRELSESRCDDGSTRSASTRVPLADGLLDDRAEPDRHFAWVEIRDQAGPGRLQQSGREQPDEKPGLDLTGVVGHGPRVGAMAILLDMSGSMTDDESKSYYRSGKDEAAPQGRLYQHAAQALRDDLLPTTANGTQFCLITFRGSPTADIEASNVDSMRNVARVSDWSSDPAQARSALASIDGDTSVEFTHYTPLATALREGRNALAVIPAPSKAMLVITDGEGTEKVLSELLVNERLKDVGPLSLRDGSEGYSAVMELVFYKGIASERPSIYEFLHDTRIPGWGIAPHEVADAAELGALLRKLRVKYGLAGP